jgi:hypothetical protein
MTTGVVKKAYFGFSCWSSVENRLKLECAKVLEELYGTEQPQPNCSDGVCRYVLYEENQHFTVLFCHSFRPSLYNVYSTYKQCIVYREKTPHYSVPRNQYHDLQFPSSDEALHEILKRHQIEAHTTRHFPCTLLACPVNREFEFSLKELCALVIKRNQLVTERDRKTLTIPLHKYALNFDGLLSTMNSTVLKIHNTVRDEVSDFPFFFAGHHGISHYVRDSDSNTNESEDSENSEDSDTELLQGYMD